MTFTMSGVFMEYPKGLHYDKTTHTVFHVQPVL